MLVLRIWYWINLLSEQTSERGERASFSMYRNERLKIVLVHFPWNDLSLVDGKITLILSVVYDNLMIPVCHVTEETGRNGSKAISDQH